MIQLQYKMSRISTSLIADKIVEHLSREENVFNPKWSRGDKFDITITFEVDESKETNQSILDLGGYIGILEATLNR
jgi:hypothetical protein